MPARRARIWTLRTPRDAAAFLAPAGVPASREPLPLPCVGVRFAPSASSPPLSVAAPPGVLVLAGARETALLGSAPRLRETAHRWGCAEGSDLVQALDRFETAERTLRWADGGTWSLGSRTRIMGIVNVTPDSFSDGGRFVDPADAADRAEQLVAEGAEIVDVGGESTRPGARPVTVDEELARVLPAIEAIRARLPDARLSIDTRHAEVARRALAAGADLVNDVSALRDPEMAGVVAAAGCPVVLMHMRGEPGTMQRDTRYVDLLGEILDFLGERVDAARAAGIAGDRILVDPGLGFGKSPEANEQLLRQSGAFHSLGCPVLIGASRKSFIGRRTGIEPPEARLAGSLAAAVIAATEGVELVRVHDVAPTRAALAVADAVREAGAPRR